MRPKQSLLRIGIFYILILAPTIIWLILSATGVAGELDQDTGEKRNKHEIAEGTNLGNLTEELELTYNDYAPFRSVLLKMNSGLDSAIEAPYRGAVLPALTALANAAMGDGADSADSYIAQAGQSDASGDGANGNGQSDGANAGGNAGSGGIYGQSNSGAGNSDGSAQGSANLNDPAQTSANPNDPSQASAANPNDPAQNAVNLNDPSQASSANPNDLTQASANPNNQAQASADLTPFYETPSSGGYYPYVELAPEVIEGRDGWLFRDETIPDYTGGTIQSDEALAGIAGNMQTLSDICKSRGQELYYIALPNKNTVYPEYMPSIDKADYTALKQLEDYVNNNHDFRFLFMDDEMLAAKRNGRLYFMTDTHWNGRGAMVCAEALHRLTGLEPVDTGALSMKESEPFIGDLIYYTGLPAETFPTDMTEDYDYKPEVAVEQIRGGDDILDEFTSSASDGRTLVYVGDSYRHHIMQYLNKDFAHTYFINEKMLGAEYADIINSANILIVENVERNFYVNPDAPNAVEALIGIASS